MPAAKALWNKTKYHTVNIGRVLALQSTFKVVFILCFAIALEAGLWAIFAESFKFLDRLGGVGTMIISRLFAVFFLGMGVMLVISSVVTAYSTIFRSAEIPFLLSRPFQISEIVLYKFIESTGFASWSFLFIIIPFVGAYAWHQKMSFLFPFWVALFSIPFLLICSGIGAVVVMLVVRWVPRSGHVKVLTAAVLLAVFITSILCSEDIYEVAQTGNLNVSNIVPGIRLSASPVMPSWWVSEGVLSLSRGLWMRGVMMFLMLLSTTMMVVMLVEWVGSLTFYESWQRVMAGNTRTDRSPRLLAGLEDALRFLDSDTKGLVMKDIRTFLRDPAQWSQSLIFFGLLGLYFSNMRSFNYDMLDREWKNIISFLNVFSISAVMCSLGSRFVYPQLSLEGQGFWMIGLSPAKISGVLITKFILALIGMMGVGLVLILISSAMLSTPVQDRMVAAGLVVAVSLAVCSFSTGLGAIFIDLRQSNPAAIVSGFGGTLNLVLCLVFMLLAIIPFASLFHFRIFWNLAESAFLKGLTLSAVWLVVLTAVSTAVPLILGTRSLRDRDY